MSNATQFAKALKQSRNCSSPLGGKAAQQATRMTISACALTKRTGRQNVIGLSGARDRSEQASNANYNNVGIDADAQGRECNTTKDAREQVSEIKRKMGFVFVFVSQLHAVECSRRFGQLIFKGASDSQARPISHTGFLKFPKFTTQHNTSPHEEKRRSWSMDVFTIMASTLRASEATTSRPLHGPRSDDATAVMLIGLDAQQKHQWKPASN